MKTWIICDLIAMWAESVLAQIHCSGKQPEGQKDTLRDPSVSLHPIRFFFAKENVELQPARRSDRSDWQN